MRKSIIGAIAWAFSGAINGLYSYIDYIQKQATPFTSTDVYLAAWGLLKGVSRNLASNASGTVTFTLSSTTTILQGTALARSDGAQYLVSAGVTGPAGTLSATVQAVDAGSAGNCPVGTSLTLVSPMLGVTPTAISGTISGGADDESDEPLRTRILARYAAPPQGGSKDDYLAWALETPGVTRAWVKPIGMGPGTVVVYTMFDTINALNAGFPYGVNGVASEETRDIPATLDLLNVANTIYPQRPATALVYSVAPIAAPVNITITSLSPNTSAIQAAITASLKAMFLQVGSALPSTIYPSDINGAIEGVSGISHYTLLTPATQFTSTIGYLPVLGTVTIS